MMKRIRVVRHDPACLKRQSVSLCGYAMLVLFLLSGGIEKSSAQNRDAVKYQSDEYAGFMQTFSGCRIKSVVSRNPVCEYATTEFRTEITGIYTIYRYKWYKLTIAGDLWVTDSAICKLERAEQADSGSYYCQVTALTTGAVYYSDTVTLKVDPLPVVRIIQPWVSDTLICPGNVVTLTGRSSIPGASLYWSGDGVPLDPFIGEIRVTPSRSTLYKLTASYNGCYSSDTVRVNVDRASVKLPEVVYAINGKPVSLTAIGLDGNVLPGNSLHWWRDHSTDLSSGNPLIIGTVDRDIQIRADYNSGKCLASAVSRIYVKNSSTFDGGDEDGFSATGKRFQVLVASTADTVCERFPVAFRARVKGVGKGLYRFTWYKAGEPAVALSDSSFWQIDPVRLPDGGKYYCKVTALESLDSVISDTLNLFVRPVPAARITVPLSTDTVVCSGDSLVLKGASPLDDATLNWRGDVDWEQMEGGAIQVMPHRRSRYILTAIKQGCSSSDTVWVDVNRSGVKLPDAVYAVKDKPVSLTAIGLDGKVLPANRLHWWCDGSTELSSGNPLVIPAVGRDMQIRADYDSGKCLASAVSRIYVKNNSTFDGGDEDGFSATAAGFRVEVQSTVDTVCEASPVTFRAQVKDNTGYDHYRFAWYKVGVPDVMVKDSNSWELDPVKLSDAGLYYCKVNTYNGQDSVISDTLNLFVHPVPVARIIEPSGADTVICSGDSLQLSGLSSVGEALLSWSGEFLPDPAVGMKIKVLPSRNTFYQLRASYNGCHSYDTVRVNISDFSILLPSIVYAVQGDTVVLTAKNEGGEVLSGSSLHWWRDGSTELPSGNPLEIPAVDRDMQIRVDEGKCGNSALSFIRVKDNGAFGGGDEDGFSVTDINFSVQVEVTPTPVCENSRALFNADVKGVGINNYSYSWYKVGFPANLLMDESRSFELNRVSLADSGYYYCVVNSLETGNSVISDTLHLTVTPLAPVHISNPAGADTLICARDTLHLTGTSSESGAILSWSGFPSLDDPFSAVMRVAPMHHSVYVLTADHKGCLSHDTVTVNVNWAFVQIPPVIYAVRGDTVVLTAKNEFDSLLLAGRLHWWRDGSLIFSSGNPLVVPFVEQDMQIRVDLDSLGCASSAVSLIHVKDNGTFDGGEEDGFSATGKRNQVLVDINPDTVCVGETVAFNATASGVGQYAYAWYHILPSKDTLVKDTCCFELPGVSLSDSGSYYCIAKDIATTDSIVSDTVLLHVLPSVNLQIVVPSGRDTAVCAGSLFSLEAETDGALDSLRWNILKKDGTLEVRTLPLGDRLAFLGITAVYDSCVIWCEAFERCGLSDTVFVRVNPSGVASLKALADNRFGQCDSINLRSLLVPRLDGVACSSGTFSVDSVSLAGDWWSRDSLRVGCHRVRYHYSQASGSCVNVPVVELCIDTLPSVRMVLPGDVCSGGLADSLKLEFSGGLPYSFTLTQERFKSDGRLQRSASVPHTVITGNRYKEIVTWLDSNAYIVYKVSGITDGYGCTIDSILTDTVVKRPKPMFDIFSRYPNRSDVSWKVRPGWQPYLIPHGDSIGVKAVLTKGTPAWDLLINDQRDAGYVRKVTGIPGPDTSFVLQDARTYQFRASRDRYCTNYLDSKYISVAFRDTGYIRLRVILEGAYNADSSRMVTGRGYRLPVNGRALPVVPGRKVIDWLEVELRTGSTADSLAGMLGGSRVLTRDTCLVLSDGTVVDRAGNEAIGLRDGYLTSDSLHRYHVVLRHRNHLSVMTRGSFYVSNRKDSTVLVDFTSDTTVYWSGKSGSLAYHMSEVSQGKWALSAGEVNANGLISLYDPNGTAKALNSTPGYHPYDVNFDGIVDWPGWNARGGRQDWYLVKMNKDKYTECRFAPVGGRP